MGWHHGPMLAFDLEATSIDPTEARIVSACLAWCVAGSEPEVASWIVDPGVEIPAEATEVHGITTEQAREGWQPPDVLAILADALTTSWQAGEAVVVMNAAYDLTLLDCELRRHNLPALADRCATGGIKRMLIVDPLVIDRHVDRYRPGKKRLEDLCRVYDVSPGDAHTAESDALAVARIAWRQAERFPQQVGSVALHQLMSDQVDWHVEYATRLQEYFDRIGKEDRVSTEWPMRAAQGVVDHGVQ